jgi:hypothetical protein
VTSEARHATRLKRTSTGAEPVVEFTNARDEDGILVELSSHDVVRLGAEGVAEYRRRRDAEIAQAKAQREEEEAFSRFEEAFVAAGGNKADASEAYKAHKNRRAAEAATRADEDARAHMSATTRGVI